METKTSRHDRFVRCAFVAATLLAVAFGIPSARASGDMQHLYRLSGEMFIAGATLVDPDPSEPAGTHAYLHVMGAPARAIFERLKAKEIADACTPGRRVKTAGAIFCSARGKADDAYCEFALDLTRGTAATGTAC